MRDDQLLINLLAQQFAKTKTASPFKCKTICLGTLQTLESRVPDIESESG